MTTEGYTSHIRWKSPEAEGYKARGLCRIVRLPSCKGTERPLSADFFTFDGSDTILGHRLLRRAAEKDVDSCKVSVAAAAAADCGVAALAAAEGEGSDAPLHLFAGLTNGQLWHVEVKQKQNQDKGHEQQELLQLSAASKQLLCCRMAEPVDVACCYIRREEKGEQETAGANGNSTWTLMVIVLYSDGCSLASWPAEDRTAELPVVERGQRLSVSPLGGFVAISTDKRRLAILERRERQFNLFKDVAPLKLTGTERPAAQPAWVGEGKLLLPGAAQLRCICRSSAWEEAKEPPCLPATGVPSELLLLQHLRVASTASLQRQKEGNDEGVICGVATNGTLAIWRIQEARPLLLVQCSREDQLQSFCCVESSAALVATLMLLFTDGSLGFLPLPPEVLDVPSKSSEEATASPKSVKAGKTNTQTQDMAKTLQRKGREKKDTKGNPILSNSVEAFLSREAAEASSEEFEKDIAADELFTGVESLENSPLKKKPREHRRRHRDGEAEDGDSSSEESARATQVDMQEDEEGLLPAAPEALASGVSALQSQLNEAQAMLRTLLKRQQEITQPLIRPGGGPEPTDAGKPWCLFWTHLGHITKTVTADNSLLDVFNFSPGAAADGTARRKLADLHNSSAASLCRAGVALAAAGSSHSILEFRSFLDAGSWVKRFPEGEKILTVAAGDCFVAAVTEDRTLRIFTHGGILLYTTDVFGRPVSLCASQQLLMLLTQTGSSEGTLQLHCSLLHIHPDPSAPTATFKQPISCLKRRVAAPPAAASSAPDIDIIHEGFFDVDSPLDWIGISPGGMPAVKDTQGIVRGLLPVAATNAGGLGYVFKWVKICSLEEASTKASLFPIVVDETKGELGVVRLETRDSGAAFPDFSISEAFFGHAMEQIPLRIPAPDLWSFSRWQRLLRQDKQLKGIGDEGGDAALVPWPQYDILRLQQELALRQLNHFVSICGGSSLEACEAEAREAQRKLQLLMKRHDKFCLRGFAKCTDDKRLHSIAKEIALRLKTESAPQHARTLLDSDTRLQAEKLREALLWQEQQRVEFREAAIAAAAAVPIEVPPFQNENLSPRQSVQQTEQEHSTARPSASASAAEKKSSIQKLLQWQQQQQQQQRKNSDRGLAALFDGQKRRASESGTGRPVKKSFFFKAD